ncbi:MAG TPA: CocE/NonD family hydrolase [Pseudonocardiaceae bacterium]|nr:CocE/NonD family hydrolase [Pseudonocardiaceae bacterium]
MNHGLIKRGRGGLTVVLLAAVAALVTPSIAAAATEAPLSSVRNNQTQDVYSYTNAIRQSVWVDTGLDANGKPGGHVRVAADIIRPSELDHKAKVPVILEASPYYAGPGRGNESQVKQYDANGNIVSFPLFYDNYFVPRGYAVVLVDVAGTNRSQGCTDAGGPQDVGSATAVIKWLNGKASGYTSLSGDTAANAYWSNGGVGMIGKSWDGTIAEGAASTGVDGLKTIVAESAISSWYNYYRMNGAVLARDKPGDLAGAFLNSDSAPTCPALDAQIDAASPDNGDFTSMYAARDYDASAKKVKASVWLTHGANDYNVYTDNLGQWWDALPASVPKQLWLSQTGHVDPFDFRRAAFVDELHRWFDHYLMGLNNGVRYDPQAAIERSPDHWVNYPTWPIPGTIPLTMHLSPSSTAGVGRLGLIPNIEPASASLTDDATKGDDDWAANPAQTQSDRLIYSTGPLAHAETVSGTTKVTLTVSSSTSAAALSAVLVDYGSTTMRHYDNPNGTEGINTLKTQSCFGDSTPKDSACYFDTTPDTETVGYDVFDRGWADLGHYQGLTKQVQLTPGKQYTITFTLNTTDHTIPAGHNLALIIGGTDGGSGPDNPYINPPAGPAPTLGVNLNASSVSLPLSFFG